MTTAYRTSSLAFAEVPLAEAQSYHALALASALTTTAAPPSENVRLWGRSFVSVLLPYATLALLLGAAYLTRSLLGS